MEVAYRAIHDAISEVTLMTRVIKVAGVKHSNFRAQ